MFSKTGQENGLCLRLHEKQGALLKLSFTFSYYEESLDSASLQVLNKSFSMQHSMSHTTF